MTSSCSFGVEPAGESEQECGQWELIGLQVPSYDLVPSVACQCFAMLNGMTQDIPEEIGLPGWLPEDSPQGMAQRPVPRQDCHFDSHPLGEPGEQQARSAICA